MENIISYRSLEAFCRQRAQIQGEDSDVWLEKAEIFARLATAESRSKMVAVADNEEKSPPKRTELITNPAQGGLS